jgi:hypothetical protein
MAAAIEWEPPADFLEKSGARLNAMFQKQFDQRLAEKKDILPVHKAIFHIQRNLAKDDKNIEGVVKDLAEKSRRRGKSPIQDSTQHQFEPLQTFGLPFTYPWTWKATTGDGHANVAASNTTGKMSFDVWTEDGTAAARIALGNYFRPASGKGIMHVYANPSISLDSWAYQVFADSSTHGFIGIYIGEYTLDGAFVRVVVDQRISLWNTEDGDYSATNSGYSLFASTAVNSNNFYEVWVWAGGDCDGDGWSLFWGSAAGSSLQVNVPSMSIYTF